MHPSEQGQANHKLCSRTVSKLSAIIRWLVALKDATLGVLVSCGMKEQRLCSCNSAAYGKSGQFGALFFCANQDLVA
jgi:hypothetical protein